MAEIIIPSKRTNGKFLHKTTKVDLTPMVDLGFLLITFFIFSTVLQQPAVMKLILPKDSTYSMTVAASTALTFILNENDSISYYDDSGEQIKHAPFGTMRNIIQQKKLQLANNHLNSEEFTLIFKPTNKSTYKNLIDALDEVTINDCRHYFIEQAD